MMLGAIFSAGWTIDDLLDLSWDQIALVGECVATYRSESISMVAEPVLAALGSKEARKRVGDRSAKAERASRSERTPEQQDAALLASLRASGFPVA